MFSPTVIGTGVTPNREIFQMLKTAGFDKWLCIGRRPAAAACRAYKQLMTM